MEEPVFLHQLQGHQSQGLVAAVVVVAIAAM
jgi:hypothetical protein